LLKRFSSLDEYRYHEALVHMPMAARLDASHVPPLGAVGINTLPRPRLVGYYANDAQAW
jgi:predicted membrane-bound spermidine synthase